MPFALLEVAGWKPGRLPSRKLVAGVIGLLAAIAMLWTPIQAGRRFYPANYLARPSLDALRTNFADLFPDSLLLLAIIAVWIAWMARKRTMASVPAMNAGERLGWFFFVIPVAGYALAQIAHALQLRYLIAALPGIAVAFACCVWRHFHGARYVSLGILVILGGWGVAKQVKLTRNPDSGYYSPVRQIQSMEAPWMSDGKRYLVVSNPSRYMEALHYSKHPERYVYFYLNHAGQHEMRTLALYYPMQFWTMDDLKHHASESALIMPTWHIAEAIRQAGIQVDMQPSSPVEDAYLH